MDGVVVIDKPSGMTSHDVVDQVRRRLGTRKVGHGGTLDPDATGVLVIGVGRATRLLSYSQDVPKRYTAVAQFGVVTSTQDASGEVLEENSANISLDDIVRILPTFRGEIAQVPPMVSAVKIGGERLYKKARRGEIVERRARMVRIHELEVVDFDSQVQRATFDVRCSAGTYMRTLVHDIGAVLGCGAHLVSLRRTEAGGFDESETMTLNEVAPEGLRPLADAVRGLKRVSVNADGARLLSHGRPLHVGAFLEQGERAAIVHDDRLVGICKKDRERLIPEKVIRS